MYYERIVWTNRGSGEDNTESERLLVENRIKDEDETVELQITT